MGGMSQASTPVTALVLCGGESSRFAGGDKTRADLGGLPLLTRLVAGLPGDWQVVCVGAPRPVGRAVTWAREEPPGGGPVAGIAAGIAAARSPYVVLVAGDLPFAAAAAPALVAALEAAGPSVDGARALDEGGEPQALLAAYRLAPLTTAVPADARDRGVRRTLASLTCIDVKVPAHACWDVDTEADLQRAAAHARAATGVAGATGES